MTGPVEVDHHAARGHALLNARRPREAEQTARQGLASFPEDPALLRLLAAAILADGRCKEAVAAAGAAIIAAPEEEWAHRLHAVALLGCRRKAEALAAARRAVAIAPQSVLPHACLVDMALANGVKELAASAAASALALAPNEPAAHQAAADVDMASRRWSDAEMHIRDALALDPQDGYALTTLGRVLDTQGRRPEALEAYAAAAQLDPTDKVAADNARKAAAGLVGLASASALAWLVGRPLMALVPDVVILPLAAVTLGVAIAHEIRARPNRQREVAELSPVAQRLVQQARAQRHPIGFLPGGGAKASAEFDACMVAIGFVVAGCLTLLAAVAALDGQSVTAGVVLGLAALMAVPCWRKAGRIRRRLRARHRRR